MNIEWIKSNKVAKWSIEFITYGFLFNLAGNVFGVPVTPLNVLNFGALYYLFSTEIGTRVDKFINKLG